MEVWGATIGDLFVNAARGMFAIITNTPGIGDDIERSITLTSISRDELMVAWLKELHYLYEVDEVLFSRFEIHRLSETELTATARGETLDLSRHRILTEIKTVTYHELEVKKNDAGYLARIIFDL